MNLQLHSMKKTSSFVLLSILLTVSVTAKANTFVQDTTTNLDEVVLLGTRSTPRVNTLSSVPVDLIDIKKISGDAPQVTLNSILNYMAPSFTSTSQAVADGTDHIDPANLRGLGPDQTLILINGKRRHTTALVNVNGTMGRGSVGTDLNTIPAMAIQRLEVLRDGAAAQYGSDAIAGVINIGLRKNNSGTQVRVTTGGNISTYYAYTEASKGDYTAGVNPTYKAREAFDGFTTQIGVNQGFKLGSKGFINLTGTFDWRDYTTRAGERTGAINNAAKTGLTSDDAYLKSVNRTRDDYRMRVGQSGLAAVQVFLNGAYSITPQAEVYVFGGVSFRDGSSAGFYRLPFDAKNIHGVFPNGYLPIITSKILDASVAAGVRGKIGTHWNYDVTNTFGTNRFEFGTNNLVNASTKNPDNYLKGAVNGLDSTKTSFDCGALSFWQNTSNIDISRQFNVLAGLGVSFGAEFRLEEYTQTAGEVASWANYNARATKAGVSSTDPVDIYGTTIVSSYVEDGTLKVPAAGANVFPGFRPNTALAKGRNSFALYTDVELNLQKWYVVDLAVRFENYSDFGSNLSFKASSRTSPFKWLHTRWSVSTGFRAPSLHQRYLFKTSSVNVAGVPTEQGTLQNDSKAAELLGIPKLKAETSFSISAGLTLDFKNFKFTVDLFQTDVMDRIVYTDAFAGNSSIPLLKQIDSLLLEAKAGSALFFANAIDTRNRGVDVVLTYSKGLDKGRSIRIDLSGTLSEVELVGSPKVSATLAPLAHLYLSPINKALLTQAFPRQKANLVINWGFHANWNFFVRGSYVGSVEHVEGVYEAAKTNPTNRQGNYYFRQELSPLFVTDLSVSYAFLKSKMRVTLGVNNLFDIYPDIISAAKGSFFKLDTDAASETYNTIIDKNVTAKDLGIANDDGLTGSNQFVYSRRTSQIGLNGRFVFLRVELNF